MKGVFKDAKVYLEKSQRLINRGFGRVEGDKLVLSPEESAYLVCKGSLEVFSDSGELVGFEDLFKFCDPVKFFAFQDLRERGLRVSIYDFREYYPVSEKDVLEIRDLKKLAGKKIAVVDEEADVTYFKVEKFDESGKHEESIEPFKSEFLNGYFITENTDLFRKYFYGVLKGQKVILSIYEGLFLMEREIMSSNVDFESVYSFGLEKIRDFERIYAVYRDLRFRNFMAKTGLKFGSEFRVYEKVKNISELRHSKYLVKIRDSVGMRELAGDVRLAGAVKKTVIYPFFGKNIEYVLVSRVKL